MAMHDFHPKCPSYHPDQIFHDGCGECEHRGKDVASALSHMDEPTFERAWKRACNQFASTPLFEEDGLRSVAEMPVLEALWMVQIILQRRGIALGTIPSIQQVV